MLILLLGIWITACQKDEFVPQDGITDPIGQTDDSDTDIDDSNNDDDQQDDSAGDEGGLSLYKVNQNEITLIKDYQVSAELMSFQQDKQRHQKIWEHVRRLIPLENREKIVEFEVFHGDGGLLGYVAPLEYDDLSRWKFAMAIDMEGDLEELNFQNLYTYVSLHEYGHVLTLNDTQIEIKDAEDCKYYFTGEGCSNMNSYINRIYELGWADIIDQHDFDAPYLTYEKHKDRFHSEYAATNPGEDIAEVFTFFVMSDTEPDGRTIAEQKVKLMYEYPELVALRMKIREKVGPITARMPVSSLVGRMKGCKHKHHNHRHN